MNDIKVSIIIPIYNMEQYLKKCLDSVINQTLKEIEIICIDDRSTDNSYKILQEYAQKDSRIIALQNEKNVGVGITRNKGIDLVNGEYIGFVDPDDYISEDYFESLYNTAKKYNSDISYTLNIYEDKNDIKSSYDINIYNYLSEKEKNTFSMEGINDINIVNQKFATKEYAFVVIWNKIFKKSFIKDNNLYFMNIKARWGDTDFTYRLLFNNPKTSYNHKPTYYYRLNPNSIVNSANVDDNIKALKHLENSINYYKEKNNELYLKYLYRRVCIDIKTLFERSDRNHKMYNPIFELISNVELDKEISYESLYNEYLLIKSNDTYEKYLLAKEMLEKNNNINNRLNELDKKINNINNRLNELDKKINQLNSNMIKVNEANANNVSKKNTNIKLFGIDKLSDRKIIYIFGIKITLKK